MQNFHPESEIVYIASNTTIRQVRSHDTPILILGFLFLVLPFAYLPVSQDPEITLRFVFLGLGLLVYTGSILIRKKTLIIPLNPVFYFFGVYLLLSGLSIFKSVNPGDGVVEVCKIFLWLVLLPVISTISDKDKNPEKVFLILSCSSLFFSLIAIFQFTGFASDIPSSNHELKFITTVASTLSNKNFFSEVLLLMLPFSCFVVAKGNRREKIMAIFSIVTAVFFILMLQSLAVLISSFVTFLIIILILIYFRNTFFPPTAMGKNFSLIIVTSGAFFLIAFLLIVKFSGNHNTISTVKKLEAASFYIQHPEQIFQTGLNKNDNSLYDRIFLATNSLKMARDHIITGCGLANWKILLPGYGMYGTGVMAAGVIRFEHPHNDYLFILCETGLPGLIVWLVFLVATIVLAFKLIKTHSHGNVKWISLCILASVISFSILSFFSYPKERFFSMLLLITDCGLLVALDKSYKTKTVSPKLIWMICMLVSVVCVIFFIRYSSEIKLMNAFRFQKNGNFHQMQTSIEQSQTRFHILDITGTPLSWHLGQAYFYQGNTDKAFECYLQAAHENPYHMQVLSDVGAMYESKGDHEKAMQYISKALSINSSFENGRLNLAAIYFNMGETDKALDIMRNIKPWFTDKWRSNMQAILLAKATKVVQSNRDTLLANELNNQLKLDQYFLVNLFVKADKDSTSFENALEEITFRLHR